MQYPVFSALESAFIGLWVNFIHLIPSIVIAIVVLIVGSIIASSLKNLVEKLFKKSGMDGALQAAGANELAGKAGFSFSAGAVIGTLVKWFVMLVFFIVALDILRLDEVTTFIREVVMGYLPRVIVASLILMAGVVIAGVVRTAVIGSATLARLTRPELFGKVAYGAIVTVAVLAALNQLQVASELIQPLFMGIVFAFSLALGLAFGLGGKDAASRIIDSVTRK
jgi:hypothetical protein